VSGVTDRDHESITPGAFHDGRLPVQRSYGPTVRTRQPGTHARPAAGGVPWQANSARRALLTNEAQAEYAYHGSEVARLVTRLDVLVRRRPSRGAVRCAGNLKPARPPVMAGPLPPSVTNPKLMPSLSNYSAPAPNAGCRVGHQNLDPQRLSGVGRPPSARRNPGPSGRPHRDPPEPSGMPEAPNPSSARFMVVREATPDPFTDSACTNFSELPEKQSESMNSASVGRISWL
jgi:hypothetical protein